MARTEYECPQALRLAKLFILSFCLFTYKAVTITPALQSF